MAGTLALRVPWPLNGVDPHRLDDATAAIFGEALFDTLYDRDETGAYVPSLAESEPEPVSANLRVRLRDGLRTAKNRPFTARDASFAIARAKKLGAAGWLSDVPAPRVDGNTLVFAMRDAARLVRALSSNVVAMVPMNFSPEFPDGTGPFAFRLRADGVTLARNPLAATGPSFLDDVVVRASPDCCFAPRLRRWNRQSRLARLGVARATRRIEAVRLRRRRLRCLVHRSRGASVGCPWGRATTLRQHPFVTTLALGDRTGVADGFYPRLGGSAVEPLRPRRRAVARRARARRGRHGLAPLARADRADGVTVGVPTKACVTIVRARRRRREAGDLRSARPLDCARHRGRRHPNTGSRHASTEVGRRPDADDDTHAAMRNHRRNKGPRRPCARPSTRRFVHGRGLRSRLLDQIEIKMSSCISPRISLVHVLTPSSR